MQLQLPCMIYRFQQGRQPCKPLLCLAAAEGGRAGAGAQTPHQAGAGAGVESDQQGCT